MRKKIVAANWKMNTSHSEAIELFEAVSQSKAIGQLKNNEQVILAIPFIYLQECIQKNTIHPAVKIAAQNCYFKDNGAFTGEISAEQLRSIGVTHVITGHSERRQYFGESDEMILQKARKILQYDMTPIFCCGESLETRKEGKYSEFIQSQLQNSIFKLNKELFSNIIIAYEPIWAIGTGMTASPIQAQEVHHIIRQLILEKYDNTTASNATILYGGSCNAKNACSLFSQKDIDGGLIGGASLKANDFEQIILSL